MGLALPDVPLKEDRASRAPRWAYFENPQDLHLVWDVLDSKGNVLSVASTPVALLDEYAYDFLRSLTCPSRFDFETAAPKWQDAYDMFSILWPTLPLRQAGRLEQYLEQIFAALVRR